MKEQDPGVRWFNTIFYPEKKKARAHRLEEGVLPRLRKNEVVLFTPWGPRYQWEVRGTIIRNGDKEIETLRFLAQMLNEWECQMPEKKLRWIFIGADIYGAKINNLPHSIVLEYFSSFAKELATIIPEASFHLWSEFEQKAEEYRKLIRANFDQYVDQKLMRRAGQTASSMADAGDPREYLIERIAEAMLIENTLEPIKISCAPRYKDDKVDMNLPRVYFVPEDLQAPWL